MNVNLIEWIERITRAFGDSPVLARSDLEQLFADEDSESLTSALAFMSGRDSILFSAESDAVYHHAKLVEIVYQCIREKKNTTPAHINEALGLPNAVTCEILGWLERDGRIELQADSNQIRLV